MEKGLGVWGWGLGLGDYVILMLFLRNIQEGIKNIKHRTQNVKVSQALYFFIFDLMLYVLRSFLILACPGWGLDVG
ncbi:MAG: hypothetical protein WCI92_13545 [Bacteroidota bacterium]